jgi:hypothetical protein
MTCEAVHLAGRDTLASAGSVTQDRAAWPASSEATLDQLLAEPIVQQLMQRDHTDEATIRDLLQEIAATRLALWAHVGQHDYSLNDIAEV